MSSNRRDFLRNSILGTGMLATGLSSQAASLTNETSAEGKRKNSKQQFNMCGYAAPKLDKVRVGFVGIGDRGSAAIERMIYIEGVEITALCDIRQAAVDGAQGILAKAGLPKAKEFVAGDLGFKQLCDSNLVDLIYVTTPWEWHVPVAVAAMEGDKHTAVEVSTAKTMDECWQIVEVSDRTRKHCVILENCCYDFFELNTRSKAHYRCKSVLIPMFVIELCYGFLENVIIAVLARAFKNMPLNYIKQ